MPDEAGRVRLVVDRDGVHLEVRNGEEGQVVHRESVGAPTTTVERQRHVTCAALLPPEGAELLARVLLNAAARARAAGG